MKGLTRIFTVVSAILVLQGKLSAQTYTMGTSGTLTATDCGGTFVDNGGSGGNYSNNVNAEYQFCPSVAGQYVSVTFTAFNTEASIDYLLIYDGNSTSGSIIGSLSGNLGAAAGTYTASTANGCLTFRFSSDGTTRTSGWSATISCSATPGAGASSTSTDCNGASTICNSGTFSGNSSGFGNMDAVSGFDGCLNFEHQSSWYYFSPSAGGTVGFTISPNNGTDDYDFALWGPQANNACPGLTGNQPLRCSYAAGGGNTGCGNGATDLSEGAFGNRWVSTFNVNAGEIYILLIDNYTASASPFTLTWSLTGGASLDCSILPIELLNFEGFSTENGNELTWQTATETNNDYFTIQRALSDGVFHPVANVDGAGTSTTLHSYSFIDSDVSEGTYYYRLRQTDFNGMNTLSSIITINRTSSNILISNIHPNPTDGDILFDFHGTDETILAVTIRDMAGRIVYTQREDAHEGNNSFKAVMDNAGAGIYLLEVKDEVTGISSVERIVKY
ncbi:MAG TPA: T9SS type A sorting domain-containing protein [Bacteroidia bacterium]|jgi:hypothetical protein|nr:T9SS type A sorting domain-containing protein [Bacteroidia bacterium]